MRSNLLLGFTLLLVLPLGACEPPEPVSGGFFIITQDTITLGVLPPLSVPHGGVVVNGSWQHDLSPTASGNILTFDVVTPADGKLFLSHGRMPARWWSGVIWNVPCGTTAAVGTQDVTVTRPFIGWECINPTSPSTPSPSFSLSGEAPSAMSVPGFQLGSSSGMPRLNVYGPNGQLYAQPSGTSVAPDGNSASFPFPTFVSGLYAYNVWNQDSVGSYRHAGMGFLSVGAKDISQPSPFGVDAINFEQFSERCDYIPPDPFPEINAMMMANSEEGGWSCNYSSYAAPYPVLTLSNTNQVSYRGLRLPVGAYPTAIKAYRIDSVTEQYGDGSTWYENLTTTQPTRAIVANYLGSSVSFVDLANGFTIATIAVGSQPAALTINAAETRAWVANYGSGTVSEIDLLSMSVVRSVYVGTGPSALTFDPVGNQLWVGGQNFIAAYNPTTMAVIRSTSTNGAVTSLALSQGQGSLVYTQVSSQSFSAQQMRLSDSAPVANYGSEPAGGFQAPPGGGGFAVQLLANGTVVSANYGNSIAVSATPSGFVVMDLVNHTEVMRGTTPSSVRAIATNPGHGIVYLTAPASNALITVPLPKAPQ